MVKVSQPARNVSSNPKSGLPRKASVAVVQGGEEVTIRDVVLHQLVPLDESQQPHRIAMPGLPHLVHLTPEALMQHGRLHILELDLLHCDEGAVVIGCHLEHHAVAPFSNGTAPLPQALDQVARNPEFTVTELRSC